MNTSPSHRPRTSIDIRTAASRGTLGNLSQVNWIVLTHGHFDHAGSLEDLAGGWDVLVYAHVLEHPYLDGSRSYPPADPWVGGGAMAVLSPLFPTGPVDVGGRLRSLPEDGSVPGMPGWRWIHTEVLKN